MIRNKSSATTNIVPIISFISFVSTSLNNKVSINEVKAMLRLSATMISDFIVVINLMF